MMDRVLNMKGSKSALGENVRTIVYALGIALILGSGLFTVWRDTVTGAAPRARAAKYRQ